MPQIKAVTLNRITRTWQSLKRWETVNLIAEQKYELSGGDEVEVYLAYRTNLTKRELSFLLQHLR